MNTIGSIPQNQQPSSVFKEAQADARNSTSDTLRAFADTFASIAHDPDADPFETFNASERLRAIVEEIDRRDRVAKLTNGQSARFDHDRAEWSQLAHLVKERCEVPELLERAGLIVTRTGRSSRTGADEFHSGCPICNEGRDRLVSWGGPNGRVWCRQCGWSTDAIGVASLIVGDDFRDIVRFLAEYAGIRGAA